MRSQRLSQRGGAVECAANEKYNTVPQQMSTEPSDRGVVVSPESDSRGCGSDCNGISARQTKTACHVKSEKDESEKITGPKEDVKGQTRRRADTPKSRRRSHRSQEPKPERSQYNNVKQQK